MTFIKALMTYLMMITGSPVDVDRPGPGDGVSLNEEKPQARAERGEKDDKEEEEVPTYSTISFDFGKKISNGL